MKRKFHEIWKGEDGKWKVQARYGVLTFKTKKEAKAWVSEWEKCA